MHVNNLKLFNVQNMTELNNYLLQNINLHTI